MLSETRPAKVGTWTEPALRVLRERYLLRKDGEVIETPEEMCWRVAVSIAAGEGRYGRSPAAGREGAEAFYDMMVGGYFIPNSPTLMNAGKGNGLQYSACYVLPVGDAEPQVTVEPGDGTRVQTSAWHPFMVVRPEGLTEVRADALAPGDVMLGPERPDGYWPYDSQRKVGQLVIDESLGWLVGFTLGDGSFGYVPSLRQYRLRWLAGERDVLERVQAVLARQGIHASIQRDARGLLSVATLTQRFVLDMLEACGPG